MAHRRVPGRTLSIPRTVMVVASCLLILIVTARAAHGACNATCERDIARCIAIECPGASTKACRRRCKPAPIRTLAYVQSDCHVDSSGAAFVGHQSLRIRRGDREPITAVEFGSSQPVPDPLGFCRHYGLDGLGFHSVLAYPLQRLGVSPDGSGVVFEVNDGAPFFKLIGLPPGANGMFFVRADGSAPPRYLGRPSADPSFRLGPAFGQTLPLKLWRTYTLAPPIPFSPNGRLIAFTDKVQAPDGAETIQIVVQDTETGKRTQVTHLPPGTAPNPFAQVPDESPYFLTCCPRFIDDRTVLFQTYTDPDGSNPDSAFAAFTVTVDGRGVVKPAPKVELPKDSQVIPSFGVAGRKVEVVRLAMPGTPTGPPSSPPGSTFPITEIFVQLGKHIVQLTRFLRVDTFPAFISTDKTHAVFLASADPLGENPQGTCQMFSIRTDASGLRQLTHFDQGYPVGGPGCFLPAIGIGYGAYRVIVQDPVTRSIVFSMAQDPLHLGRYPPVLPSGQDQIFAMRPDGSGLRQLTDAAGVRPESDGGFGVESPGPFAYSAQLR